MQAPHRPQPVSASPCLGLLALLLGSALGCRQETPVALPSRLPALVALGAKPGGAIVAQGQIEPQSGVLALVAPAGDRVELIVVKEAQQVKQGEVLGRLASQAAKELELEIAIAKREEILARQRAEEATANARVEVAKVGLRQSKLTLEQATKDLQVAEAPTGKLGLLAQQLSLAESKLSQLRAASTDRDGGRLVTSSGLEQQQLQVDQLRSELNAARRTAEQAIQDSKLAIEVAEKEIRANELAIAATKASGSLQSADKQIELLRLQLQSIQLVSPTDATVLSIDTGPGEHVTTAPVIRLADTRQMIVRAEVNVAEVNRVKIGAKAMVTSPALTSPVAGTVTSISQLVGSPRLPNPNPMARVDWRSAEVIIQVDEASTPTAAERIMLQVDVAIEAAEMPSDKTTET